MRIENRKLGGHMSCSVLLIVSFLSLLSFSSAISAIQEDRRNFQTLSSKQNRFRYACSCRCITGIRSYFIVQRSYRRCLRNSERKHFSCRFSRCHIRIRSGYRCCRLPVPSPSPPAIPSSSVTATVTPSTTVEAPSRPSVSSSPSPSSSIVPISPSPSQSISASPSNGSPTDINNIPFEDLTSLSGTLSMPPGSELETSSGQKVSGSYSFSFIPEGVVSLSGAAPVIESVTCDSSEPSVHIVFSSSFKGALKSLDEMYPVGCILTVSAESFGDCILQDEESSSGVRFNSRDGFLIVTSVSGTVSDHMVFGRVASYFDMFSESLFNLDHIRGDEFVPTSRSTVENGTIVKRDEHEDMLSYSSGKDLVVQTEKTFGRDEEILLSGKVKVKATVASEFDSISGESNRVLGKKFGFKIKYSMKFEAEIEFAFDPIEKEIPERIIYEIPPLPLYGIRLPIPSGSLFKGIPDLEIGLFVEAPVFFRGKIAVEAGFKLPIKYTFESGQKEYAFEVDAGLTGVSTNLDVITDEDGKSEFSDLSLSEIFSAELKGSFFIGVKPALAIDAVVADASIYTDAGLAVEGKIPLTGQALPAVEDSGLLFGTFGDCDKCHFLQLAFDAKIENISVEGSFAGEEAFNKEIGNVSFALELAKACLLPTATFGTCGPECCSSSQSCVSDRCLAPTMLATPSPSPTAPATSAVPKPQTCTTRPTLRTGAGFSSTGQADLRDAVRDLQTLLNEKIMAGLSTDGLFGSGTEQAVRDYQTINSLSVEGIVGPDTWESLCS